MSKITSQEICQTIRKSEFKSILHLKSTKSVAQKKVGEKASLGSLMYKADVGLKQKLMCCTTQKCGLF